MEPKDINVEETLLNAQQSETATIADISAAIDKAISNAVNDDPIKKNPQEVDRDIYAIVTGAHVYRTFKVGNLEFTIQDQKYSDVNNINSWVLNKLRDLSDDQKNAFITRMNCATSLVSIKDSSGSTVVELPPFPSAMDTESEEYLKLKAEAIMARQKYVDTLHFSVTKRIIEEAIRLNVYIQAIIDQEAIANF